MEFGERHAPSKCSIQKLVKKLETGEAADFFFWGLLKGKVYKNTSRTLEQLKDAIRQEIQAVNVDTLGKVFQNLEKRISMCLDVKRDQFQHRL
jgi:fatty acid/phospholipid biosynthesis enzyme